jgi:hypothetical protein
MFLYVKYVGKQGNLYIRSYGCFLPGVMYIYDITVIGIKFSLLTMKYPDVRGSPVPGQLSASSVLLVAKE